MRNVYIRTGIGIATTLCASATAKGQGSFDVAIRFVRESPSAAEPYWADNAQGLAHDASHWFVTNNQGQLWRIPASASLCCTEPDDAGVSAILIQGVPALAGYAEFKDPICRPHLGVWYLFVPVTGPELPMAVAVFRADTLEFLDHQTIINDPAGGMPLGGDPLPSWCAIDGSGKLVMPYRFPGPSDGIIECSLDWAALAGPAHQLVATFVRTVQLLDFNGSPLFFENPQGGEYSLDGKLLYTVTGYLDDTEEEQVSEGIHVFDTTTWRRIEHSTNGSGLFNYHYDPDGLINQEPQGITMWDLDGAGAPGAEGQVHVMMLNNDWPDSDNIHISHYTKRIWVNAAAEPGVGNGTLSAPFSAVGQAAGLSWNGCEIRIGAGVYDEAVTFNRRVKLIADGGTARIGG